MQEKKARLRCAPSTEQPRVGYIRSPGVLRLSSLSATITVTPSPPYGSDLRRHLLRQRAPKDGMHAPSLLFLMCETEQHPKPDLSYSAICSRT